MNNNLIIPATIVNQVNNTTVIDDGFLGDNSLNLNFFNGENLIATEDFTPVPATEKKR